MNVQTQLLNWLEKSNLGQKLIKEHEAERLKVRKACVKRIEQAERELEELAPTLKAAEKKAEQKVQQKERELQEARAELWRA